MIPLFIQNNHHVYNLIDMLCFIFLTVQFIIIINKMAESEPCLRVGGSLADSKPTITKSQPNCIKCLLRFMLASE